MKSAYKGYEAYSYLEKGKDISSIEMCNGDKRVDEYLIELDDVQEEKVKSIVDEKIFISLHEHPVLFPEHLERDIFEYNREGKQRCAYEALSRGYYDAIFDNLMDGVCTITSNSGWKWDDILIDLGMRLCDLAHQDFVIKCEKVEDIYRAKKEGKVALIPTLEGAAPIENELDRIDILYGFGIRLMGITYSESNALGSGLKEEKDGGLTNFGRKAVERMNKIGMAIDCSHVGVQTTLDVIEHSQDPIILSHVGARSLWNTKRLTPDEVLIACAKKGGVIGVEAAPHTTITEKNKEHSIESFMEHFEYIKNLVGIDHVAFGPDTVYGDHVKLHSVLAAKFDIKKITGTKEHPKVEYVKGLENPTETSKNIVRYLVKHGYSDEEIEKVLGGNILRVLNKIWK
ncbi:dipeptidase [Clostridioides difficile]|nr:diguanylate cyclase [Clostridioides difficile]